MKGNMSESDFKAWAMQAALAKDEAIRKLEEAADAEKERMITAYLRAERNKKIAGRPRQLCLGRPGVR